MQNLFFKLVSAILIGFLLFPPQAFAASENPIFKPTVVFVPVNESNEELNAINGEFIASLRQKLKSDFNVLDSDVVKQIIKTMPETDFASSEQLHAYNLIQQGIEAYTIHQDLEKADKILQDAEDYIIANVPPTKGSSELVISSMLTRAWMNHRENKQELAQDIIQAILALSSEKIETKGFSKDFQKFFSEIQSNDGSEKTGTLHIQTMPQAVDVFIDGVFIGASPVTKNLAAEKHALSFSAGGRQSKRQTVLIKPDKEKNLNTKISWNYADSNKHKVASWEDVDTKSKLALSSQIASATEAHRTVFFNVNKVGSGYELSAKVFDNEFNQALKTIYYQKKITNLKKESNQAIDFFAAKLRPYLQKDSIKLWKGDYDPDLMLDQRIASRPQKPLYKKPAFWGVVGGVVITGIVLGLTLSGSGGSGSGGTGSVSVDFGDFK